MDLIVEEAVEPETISQSLNGYLEAKDKLTNALLPYINEAGKIEWEKHEALVVAREEFLEKYVRYKYQGKQLESAREIIRDTTSQKEFMDKLVELVCRTQTSESQRGSQQYLLQVTIRKSFSTFFLSILRNCEEHHQQQNQLKQVRS